MTEEELIRTNMLIHGHNPVVDLISVDKKLVDIAANLAMNEDYEKVQFRMEREKLKEALEKSKIFFQSNFNLHKISYANELIMKLKLNGRKIKSEEELIRLYNNIGRDINPFKLPVKLVNKPYYYGNVSLVTNISEDDEFLSNMKLFFKNIDLSNKTSSITSVCYVHEIVHTQLESLKGIVEDYYNSELLSIFLELVYSYMQGEELLSEVLKNRINLFLCDIDGVFKYALKIDMSEGKWENIIGCKYIVSTIKAFNLFNRYYYGSSNTKIYILNCIQDVFDGKYTLEDMLKLLDITYENSLDNEKVLKLIRR